MPRRVRRTPCRSSKATTLDLADLDVTRFEAGTSWIGLSPKDPPAAEEDMRRPNGSSESPRVLWRLQTLEGIEPWQTTARLPSDTRPRCVSASRPPAARARQGARRQSSRTHAVIPAGSIDSPSRAGFAFPVGQSSSRFLRAVSRCAATCSAEALRPLFRATEPGTIPVPHGRRSSGVASGRGFLSTVLLPRTSAPKSHRRRRVLRPHALSHLGHSSKRLVRRDRLDSAARLPGGSQTRTRLVSPGQQAERVRILDPGAGGLQQPLLDARDRVREQPGLEHARTQRPQS